MTLATALPYEARATLRAIYGHRERPIVYLSADELAQEASLGYGHLAMRALDTLAANSLIRWNQVDDEIEVWPL